MLLRTKLAVLVSVSLLLGGGVTYNFLQPHSKEGAGPGHNNPGTNLPPSNPTNIEEMVNASNQFALEMFSNLSNDKDNLFFSPYSIFTALGMTYEGARGSTADEMRSVFHFPADNQTRWSLFKGLIERINAKDPKYQLSTANAMWVHQDFGLLDDYITAVRTYYKADAFNVDYKQKAEDARVRINTWVEDQTNGKIKDLIPQGVLDNLTRLVLTNAIYFKGDWLMEFNQSLTKQTDFHPGPGKTVQVPMMERNDDDSKFNYADSDGVQILEMKYAGEKLSMLVLLPKNEDAGSIEKMLTTGKLHEWRGKLQDQRVDVYLPKFKLETKYFLKGTLVKMGMPAAFSDAADFSGMDGMKDLYISEVIHQAFVSVDEKGTEAAAATAVVMELGAIGPANPVFNADHPFIFIIQDRETGNILFMGKVVDPTK